MLIPADLSAEEKETAHKELLAFRMKLLKQNKMAKKTITLYRPVNDKELALIKELEYKGFPPRLPEQPFFYPVMNEAYATQITRDWNVPAYGCGFVTAFDVDSDYLKKFDVQNVGGAMHNELWVPAEDLEEFNRNIVGLIRVIGEYRKE